MCIIWQESDIVNGLFKSLECEDVGKKNKFPKGICSKKSISLNRGLLCYTEVMFKVPDVNSLNTSSLNKISAVCAFCHTVLLPNLL